MLANVTDKYKIPVTCSRGWSDIHSRAAMLHRCAQHDQSMILMFGDHDPGGLSITSAYKDNLDDVLLASGLSDMPDIYFERVGLNAVDIDSLGLVWIDGLETSSGKDLALPSHPDHKSRTVQEYLSLYGPRKCEANALLRNTKAAEDILINSIVQYIEPASLIDYQESQLADRAKATQFIQKAMSVMESL